MAAVRAWHPVRLTLVCVILAVAGGSPAARGAYAEVSTPSVAMARARAQARAAQPAAPRPAAAAASCGAAVAPRPALAQLVVTRLYLAHRALLL